jgi:hypothetical protein
MAETALQILIGELRDDRRGSNGDTDRVLDHQLVVRSSTGPAGRKSDAVRTSSGLIDKPATSR